MRYDRILKHVAKHNPGLARVLREYPMGMGFERSLRRAVYVVQVYTATVGRALGVNFRHLRVVPARRCQMCKDVRGMVADQIRELRPSIDEVRDMAERVMSDPTGHAERIDIDAELLRLLGE